VSKRILVPLDGTERAEWALPDAELIARVTHARLVLLRAVAPDDRATLAERRRAADRYLSDLARRIADRGTTTQTVVATGSPAEVLRERACQVHADLLVVAQPSAAEAESGLTLLATAALRLTQRPVLLVQAGPDGRDLVPLSRSPAVAVPLDGSPEAEAALPLAAELARAIPAEIVLLSVVNLLVAANPEAAAAWPIFTQSLPEYDEQIADTYLTTVAQRLTTEGVPTIRTVRVDKPDLGIAGGAALAGAALIVMTTHGWGDNRAETVGPTARDVLKRADVPVLLVPT
jgi:nucleotide-binding universal stress UspA family protein